MAAIAGSALFANVWVPALESMSGWIEVADRQEPRVALALMLGAASMRFFVSVLFHLLGADEQQ